MPIHVRAFAGELPKVAPRLLPDTNAAFVSNARLASGDLDPMRLGPVIRGTGTGTQTFYRNPDGTFLDFADATTRVVPGPVATDRLYITATLDVPRMRVGATIHSLALAAPTTPPVLGRTGALDQTLKELVLYAYTWVTGYAEESQPSPPAGIEWSPGCTVNLAQMQPPPAGRNITRRRIYRSVTTGSGETEFLFVAEVAASVVNWTHDIEANPLQEAITTHDFDPPPGDLRGIVAMPNGIMAAYSGKEVMFCEPYKPHAWPAKYRLAVTDPIVALAAFGSSLAILTTGTPWVAQGLHPESMAMEKSEQAFPCLAARGVVDMGYAAIYPSTDGLVEVTQSGARLLSSALWSRAQWENLAPTSFRAAQFNGRYVFSHIPTGQTVRQLGIVDTRGEAPFYARSDVAAEELVYDLGSGDLLYLDATGGMIRELDPSNLSATRQMAFWRSKPFYTGRPISLGAIFVEASAVVSGSVVRVFADGAQIASIPHSQFNRVARLPSGRWNEVWFEIEGQSTVNRVSLGQMPDEVRQ